MTDDELPPELRDMIAAERDAPEVDAAQRAAIRAKIGVTLGIATGAGLGTTVPAKAAAAAATSGKLAATVVAVAIAGAGVTAVVHSRLAAPRSAPMEMQRVPRAPLPMPSSAPPAIARPQPVPAAPAVPPAAVVPVPAKAEPVPARTAPAPLARPAESALLGDASRALASGDAQRVLELVEQDARMYPDGALAEERDALEIEALLALGRRDQARDAARRFATHYPNSVHQALVDRASKESP